MTEQKERILIYATVGIIIVLLIIVLAMIWIPDSKIIRRNLNSCADVGDYETVQKEYYTNKMKKLLVTSNYSELFDKIDKKWLDDMKLDKDTLYDWLKENKIIKGSYPVIKSITCIPAAQNYYYRMEIEITDENGAIDSRYVVVNESVPNVYTVSFEQNAVSGLSGKTFYATYKDNFRLECKITSVMSNIIQYDIQLDNIGDKYFHISLATMSSLILNMKNGTHYKASDITSLTDNAFDMDPGSYLNFKATFNVVVDSQNDIENLTFTDVNNGNGSIDLTFKLEEGE